MQGHQIPTDFTTETLSKRVIFLEAALEKDVVISEKSADLLKLSAELEAEKFKYAQLQRMIYGS